MTDKFGLTKPEADILGRRLVASAQASIARCGHITPEAIVVMPDGSSIHATLDTGIDPDDVPTWRRPKYTRETRKGVVLQTFECQVTVNGEEAIFFAMAGAAGTQLMALLGCGADKGACYTSKCQFLDLHEYMLVPAVKKGMP